MSSDGSFRLEAETRAEAASEPATRRVWDLPLRVFHWALMLAFIGAYVTHRLGVEYFRYHVWCGYTVLVLVMFRVLWGIAGTQHAQFRNFVRGPAAVWRYAVATLRGGETRYAGHNPLGALMVVVLLLSLLTQALAGLFANDEIFNLGPLYAYVNAQHSLQLTSLHRQLFWWILGAVALHVLAVVAHRIFRKEKLVQAMITGRKPAALVAAAEEISSSRIWLAALMVIALAGTLVWIVKHAPVADIALY